MKTNFAGSSRDFALKTASMLASELNLEPVDSLHGNEGAKAGRAQVSTCASVLCEAVSNRAEKPPWSDFLLGLTQWR